MSKIKKEIFKKFKQRYLAIFLLGGLLLTIGLAYGTYEAIHHTIIALAGSKTVQPAPDGPMIILPSPPVISKASIPVAPSVVEPTLVTKPRPIVVTAPSSPVSSLTPTSSSSGPTSSSAPTSSTTITGYTSTNWAGYIAATGGFTAIAGSWTVPKPTGNGVSTSGDAAWIGIGGVTTSDLIQVGTENQVDASGLVSVAIFYELLPASAQIVTTVVVNPGDVIRASLTGSAGVWTISATDTTTGQTFSTIVNYASSLSSAEWIEEDPAYSSGQLVPFDSFGTISFTGGSATHSGGAASLATLGAQAVTLVNKSGQPLATPSALNAAGTGFSVTRN